MANSSTIRNRLTHTNWKLAFKPFLCTTSTRRLMIFYSGCPFFLSQLPLFFSLFGYLLWFSPSSHHLIVNFIILIFPILRRFVFTFYLLILNSQLHSTLYRGWLGQHRFCYNTNTWPSFLNSWMSFWFFLKAWKTWPIVWKTRPYVLKHILVRVFCKI